MAHSPKASLLLFLTLLFSASMPVSAAESNGAKESLQEGITLFSNSLYDAALVQFQNVTLDKSADEVLKASGYFWIAKTYMALGSLDQAEKNLEFYLATYPDAVDHAEALYQKGRLLFMQEEFEAAIQELQSFISANPKSPFAGNAYFWVGESLYNLGRLDEAMAVYEKIVRDYPTSFKVETAQYRLSLINLMKREEELTKLLKWSHEDFLKSTEEYQRREKTYEEAIADLQKKLATGQSAADLQTALAAKAAEADRLAAELEALKTQIAAGSPPASTTPPAQSTPPTTPAQAPQAAAPVEPPEAPAVELTENQKKLLALKEQALALKEIYLKLLAGGGK